MSSVLKKSSGLLFSFIFISCSNPLAGPDLSIYDTFLMNTMSPTLQISAMEKI